MEMYNLARTAQLDFNNLATTNHPGIAHEWLLNWMA